MALSAVACASTIDPSPDVVPANLVAKAVARGWLPVIVHLRVPATPEGDRQRAIKMVQEAVLREIAHTRHRVSRRYETVPLLALDASADALRALRSSRHVVAVEEDTLAAPQ